MKKYRVIIPSWAPLSVDMQAEAGCKYPAYIQLWGKPMYSHIIRFYEEIRHDTEFILILPDQTPSLQIDHVPGYDVRILYLKESSSIGNTVWAAMEGISAGQSIIVHMADTLISPNVCWNENDALYVELRSDLYRWTSIRKEASGAVRVVMDRDHKSAGAEQTVCVGVFMLTDGLAFAVHLKVALDSRISNVDPFFSAIEAYSDQRLIDLRTPEYWYDCGHIDSYYESRLKHHNLRHFNSLSYDAQRGLVTKRSQNTEAFRHQVRWFKQIPDDLSSFLPRIYDSSDGPLPHITMELLSIPTLSEIFVSCRMEVGAWNEVARKINNVQSMLFNYAVRSSVAKQIAAEVYVTKTRNRILQFCEQRAEARSVWVDISGERFGLENVMATLEDYAKKSKLMELQILTPIHGDMCFSNIMYDPRGRHIKLIDPRGEFGVPGIYGDPRYDKAKLMHSYAGGYDLIVTDQFDVNVSANGELNSCIKRNEYHNMVKNIFDVIVLSDEAERRQCDAIQALLFLSMLPLHSDKPERQLAMLHIGLNKYASNLYEEA